MEHNLIKPKRPLSAYNLFYRYKRQKILEALASDGSAVDKDAITRLITTAPGLENHHPTDADASPDIDMLGALRTRNIRRDLEPNMEARDTDTRLHRKDKGSMNGAMSFVELGKLMNTSWKECDEFAKTVFKELAEEGRERYRHRVKEFNARKQVLDYAMAQSSKKAKAEAAIVTPNGARPSFAGAVNETAEILTQLPRGVPSMGARNDLLTPSLRDMFSQPPQLPQDRLAGRVRELESQLAEERLRNRILQHEDEMSNRNAREAYLRSVIASGAPHSMMSHHSFGQDGLWGHASAGRAHPGRDMLLRDMEGHRDNMMPSKRPSPALEYYQNTTDERPSKRSKDARDDCSGNSD